MSGKKPRLRKLTVSVSAATMHQMEQISDVLGELSYSQIVRQAVARWFEADPAFRESKKNGADHPPA